MLVEQGTQTDISPLLGSFDAESHNVPDANYETEEKNEEDASIVHWNGPDDPVLPCMEFNEEVYTNSHYRSIPKTSAVRANGLQRSCSV